MAQKTNNTSLSLATHTQSSSYSSMNNRTTSPGNSKYDILVSQRWTLSRPWLVPSHPVRDCSCLLLESKLHCTLRLTDLLRSACRPKLCPPDGDTQSELAPRDASERLIWRSLKHLREPGLELGQGNVCAVCVCVLAVKTGWMDLFYQSATSPE